MTTSPKTPRVFLFDDDEQVLDCWKVLVENSKLSDVHFYRSWEQFLQEGDASQVQDAIVFVDFNFVLANSRFNGIQIAAEVKRLGARIIYSISGNPGVAESRPDLFKAPLGKFPQNLRDLVEKQVPHVPKQ